MSIKVAIIMGSESDAEEMKPASDILNELDIEASGGSLNIYKYKGLIN